MGPMKTPGVYIVEKDAFPNSVVQVATAVPAFIGYTETAANGSQSLHRRPWRITSMADYHAYFGFGPTPTFALEEKAKDSDEPADLRVGGQDYVLEQKSGRYLLYAAMKLFFQNGGGTCYVVSVGSYEDDVDPDALRTAIDLLGKEQEPTLVVIPESVLLSQANCITVQQAMLAHCGGKMKNRFAVLDIWDGWRDRQDPAGDPVEAFRNALGVNFLDYGAAYYPWLRTTIFQDRDLSYENVANPPLLQQLIRTELRLPEPEGGGGDGSEGGGGGGGALTVVDRQQQAIQAITTDWPDLAPEEVPTHKAMLDKTLRAISGVYGDVLAAMATKLNLLPPGAAMVGVYTMVDATRGVWKAPANVSLNSVVAPSVNISHEQQEDLNVTPQGKSINAIRPFIGEGVLVWGARTLDGNSLDWRYVNVRRTMLMIEESIRLATKAYVFEPNTANTWVTIRSMIRNFLTGIWKAGGLAGAVPEDAFSVHVGLGETMTSEDILEGILRVTVLVAVTRPAEFIEITFQQQMQRS
ncbi:MAG: phage tail sheath family protein [Geminicoccaceae bacterium]|nr:MAG: phage tail sheath family protein [Geminicoccaceae bacterium]